jgi:predicted transcriptional regulator
MPAGSRDRRRPARLADWVMMKRRDIAGTRLGGLEAELMELLWAAGEPLGVRELAGLLPEPRRASTTIVTVLTHLMDKGLVERAGDGRRYTYRPAGDPDQLTARAIERLLAAAGDRRAVLAHLVNGAQDPGLLAELAALIQQTQPGGDAESRP